VTPKETARELRAQAERVIDSTGYEGHSYMLLRDAIESALLTQWDAAVEACAKVCDEGAASRHLQARHPKWSRARVEELEALAYESEDAALAIRALKGQGGVK
jgi:hypothetical protein